MTPLLSPQDPSATPLSESKRAMDADRLVKMRRAWRGSSSRFFSPALWMSDEELEMVAARVKGCSAAAIHRAVQAAEAALDLLDGSNREMNGNIRNTSETQTPHTQSVGRMMKSRTLKVEAVGDFFYGKIKPRIRISGKWLERAGFKPGHRVEIQLLKQGEMALLFKEQLSLLTLDDRLGRETHAQCLARD